MDIDSDLTTTTTAIVNCRYRYHDQIGQGMKDNMHPMKIPILPCRVHHKPFRQREEATARKTGEEEVSPELGLPQGHKSQNP